MVRLSPSSTRRCVAIHGLGLLTLNHRDEIGKDHEEGRAPARVHCLQIQDAALTQALQAVRCSSSVRASMFSSELCSFELGGEKKTKGAALQFVRPISHVSLLSCIDSRSRSDCISSIICCLCLHVLAPYLRSCLALCDMQIACAYIPSLSQRIDVVPRTARKGIHGRLRIHELLYTRYMKGQMKSIWVNTKNV